MRSLYSRRTFGSYLQINLPIRDFAFIFGQIREISPGTNADTFLFHYLNERIMYTEVPKIMGHRSNAALDLATLRGTDSNSRQKRCCLDSTPIMERGCGRCCKLGRNGAFDLFAFRLTSEL